MSGAACALQGRLQRFLNPDLSGLVELYHNSRDWNRGLEMLPVNEKFLESASHNLALITSLRFEHATRLYCRLSGLARSSGWRRRDGFGR